MNVFGTLNGFESFLGLEVYKFLEFFLDFIQRESVDKLWKMSTLILQVATQHCANTKQRHQVCEALNHVMQLFNTVYRMSDCYLKVLHQHTSHRVVLMLNE